MPTNRHHYFISFVIVDSGSTSFQNCDMFLPNPVRGFEDINFITQALRDRHHVANVVLISFAPLAQ